jgi:hypothetical protein
VRDPFRAFSSKVKKQPRAQPALIKDVHVNIALDVPRFGHVLAADGLAVTARQVDDCRRADAVPDPPTTASGCWRSIAITGGSI